MIFIALTNTSKHMVLLAEVITDTYSNGVVSHRDKSHFLFLLFQTCKSK